MFCESADKVAPKVGNSTTTIRGRRKPVFLIRLGVGIRKIIKRETTEVSGDSGESADKVAPKVSNL